MPSVQGVHAYLDDSMREPVAVCAAVVLDASRVDEAEAALKYAKESYGVDAATPIHCREMFNLEARRTGPWARFSDEELRPFVSRACLILKRVTRQQIIVVGSTKLKGLPPEQGASGFPGFQPDAKGAASLAYVGVMAHLRSLYRDVGLRIWIDRETTRIPWGRQRRQAQNTRQVYLDLGPGIEPEKVAPEPMTGPRPPLLEIADVYAFAALQVACARSDALGRWAQILMAHIQPIRGIYTEPPEGPRWNKNVGFHLLSPPDDPGQARLVVVPGLPEDHAHLVQPKEATVDSRETKEKP